MTLSPIYHPLSEAAEIEEIANDAIRLDNCINGNPRYYMGASSFRDMYGKFYRPAYVKAYRGKKYGSGWGITSYNLKADVAKAYHNAKVVA